MKVATKDVGEAKMEKELSGKTAFVSGGTKGIGLEIARGLAEKGANVVINYFRSRQSAKDAEDVIKNFGVDCY
ncbi:MAG: SDR family NAD(P)-dependent oxidoreductase, partial [bacterium]|nr:SDR family NAD(P)-dependent oxidoreductase [bacterium]